VAILVGLFLIQRTGTARVGTLFGPIVTVYFITLAVLGTISIARDPGILWALNPWYAFNFFLILTKVLDGGWFPLAVGLVIFTMLTTWARGRKLMLERLDEAAIPLPVFIKSASNSASRVPGTAIFMTTSAQGVPHSLLHNLKHNKVLHERVMLLTVKIEDVPYVSEQSRIEVFELGNGFYRLIIRYGFMQETDVPATLQQVEECGPRVKMMDTSFFLARQTLLAAAMPLWRERLFAWMLRNAESAMESFKLPPNRVVELGSQVGI
jgi:KUP system potassium uptake protein